MFHTITISHIVPYDYRTNTNRIIFEQLENEYGVTINERRGKYKKLSLSPCIGIWIDFWKINMDAFPVNMDYKYFINIYFNPLEMITSSRIHNTNELDIPLIREKFNDALRYVSNDFMDLMIGKLNVLIMQAIFCRNTIMNTLSFLRRVSYRLKLRN